MDYPELLKKAAEGDMEARYELGKRYVDAAGYVSSYWDEDWQVLARNQWCERRAAFWFRQVLDVLRPLAEQGDAEACNRLGEMHEAGEGVPENQDQASAWFRKAGDLGHGGACFNLGWMRRRATAPDEVEQKNFWFGKARELLTPRAEQGDPESCDMLGKIFNYGWGIEADKEQANFWSGKKREIRRALAEQGNVSLDVLFSLDNEERKNVLLGLAEQGNAEARFRLAEMYMDSYFGMHDPQAGLALMLKAAEGGNTEAMFELARSCQSDHDSETRNLPEAFAWYRRAAEGGHVRALLACLDLICRRGNRDSKPLAIETLAALAEAGHAEACFLLGTMHREDMGVRKNKKNRAQSLALLDKAAEAGLAEAQLALGEMLREDGGAAEERGVALIRRAADQGDAEALCCLAQMCRDGDGVPQDRAQALRLCRQAAEQGHDGAACLLSAWAEETGTGDAGDGGPDAADALRAAAEGGNVDACLNLARLCRFGEGLPQDFGEAARWYARAVVQCRFALADGQQDAVDAALTALTEMAEEGHAEVLESLRNLATEQTWGRGPFPESLYTAQYILGSLYARGAGLPKDESAAVVWFRRACETSLSNDRPVDGLCELAKQDNLEAIRALFDLEDSGRGLCLSGGRRTGGLVEAAKKGNPEALFLAGELYRKGTRYADYHCFEAKAFDKAEEFYAKAAKKGHEAAREALAALPGIRETCEKADQGDAEACFRLGEMYETGQGRRQNNDAAIHWYGEAVGKGQGDAEAALRRLAEQGHDRARETLDRQTRKKTERQSAMGGEDAEALFVQGWKYRYGDDDVPRDEELAADLIRKAAELGHALAQDALADMCEYEDEEQSRAWRIRSAEQGNLWAQNKLAEAYWWSAVHTVLLYKDPHPWVTIAEDVDVAGLLKQADEDAKQAIFWQRKVMEAGDDAWPLLPATDYTSEAARDARVSALKRQAKMCEHGIGMAQDLGQAVRWYNELAAMDGFWGAAGLVDLLMNRGFVEAKSSLLALAERDDEIWKGWNTRRWLFEGTEAGDADALAMLCKVAANGDSQCLTAVRKQAKAGNAAALHALGGMYEQGRGVKQDAKEAVSAYRKAAEAGHAEAVAALARLTASGDESAKKALTKLAKAGNAEAQKALEG